MLITMITWPAIQLVAAILIIALVIFVLGIVAGTHGPGAKQFDILGLGLMGTSGAIKWLVMSFGSIFAVLGGYFLIANVFRRKRFLDALFSKVPFLGTS